MAARSPMGLEHPGVLDVLVFDERRKTVVLAMYETRPWTGEERQLFELQEKLNAYASFAIDGEMATEYPEHAGKPVEFQLRTRHEPSPGALDLIARAREQLSFQQIGLVVILTGTGE